MQQSQCKHCGRIHFGDHVCMKRPQITTSFREWMADAKGKCGDCEHWGTRNGSTGCLLSPTKPCDIGYHRRKGEGCFADPPRFEPFQKSTEAFEQVGKPRFVTHAGLQADIKRLIAQIPADITAVVGVARSGMGVASLVAMHLHRPLFAIRQTQGDVISVGNGWRLSKEWKNNNTEKAIVIDDTVMSGNSMEAIRPIVADHWEDVTTAAVYVNPAAKLKPDFWVQDLAWPHLLEWNLFNSVLSPSVAVDFDGVLCRDCKPEEDDDGERYADFIRTAQPLYLPRKVPIPLIVTARIEKYRHATSKWLKRHGIRWNKLVMHPAKTLAERNRDDIARYKARHVSAWLTEHTARPGPAMFVESDDRQAKRIAARARCMVLCPTTGKVY